MNSFSRFYKNNFPGPLTRAIVWAQTSIFPARHYRRVNAIMRTLGHPRAVLAGPFKGMKYTESPDKAFLSRLFGTYELETYPAVEKLVAFQPETVVVAGAGEGYFAVGMALRLPRAKVHAFEIWKWAVYLLGRSVRRNGVQDRVLLRGFCTPDVLAGTLADGKRAAIVCDIEGGENEVLDPAAVPALAKAAMLVELHPMVVPDIEQLMRDRFGGTHSIETMSLSRRTATDASPFIRERLTADDIVWATDEIKVRGMAQDWMLLLPNSAT